jgi:hypothetical protein
LKDENHLGMPNVKDSCNTRNMSWGLSRLMKEYKPNSHEREPQNAYASIRERRETSSNTSHDSDMQLSKMAFGRRETFECASNTTRQRRKHSMKHLPPSVSPEEGIRIDGSERHDQQAPVPISETFDPGSNEKLPRKLHFPKQAGLSLSTEAGRQIDVTLVMANARFSILEGFDSDSNVATERSLQQCGQRTVTDLGMQIERSDGRPLDISKPTARRFREHQTQFPRARGRCRGSECSMGVSAKPDTSSICP